MSLLPSPLTVLDSVYDGAVKSVTYTSDPGLNRVEEMRLLRELRDSISLARFKSRKKDQYSTRRGVYATCLIPTARTEEGGQVRYVLPKPRKWEIESTLAPGWSYENEVSVLIVTDDEVIMPIGRVGIKVTGKVSDGYVDSPCYDWEGFSKGGGRTEVFKPVWQSVGVVVRLRRNDAVNAALAELDKYNREMSERYTE